MTRNASAASACLACSRTRTNRSPKPAPRHWKNRSARGYRAIAKVSVRPSSENRQTASNDGSPLARQMAVTTASNIFFVPSRKSARSCAPKRLGFLGLESIRIADVPQLELGQQCKLPARAHAPAPLPKRVDEPTAQRAAVRRDNDVLAGCNGLR